MSNLLTYNQVKEIAEAQSLSHYHYRCQDCGKHIDVLKDYKYAETINTKKEVVFKKVILTTHVKCPYCVGGYTILLLITIFAGKSVVISCPKDYSFDF